MIDSRSAWTRFWKYDRLASFVAGPGAPNYDERIASGWREFFESLPDESRVLDLCTGNGAIAVLAVETAERCGKHFSVTGLDLADIAPAAFVSRSRDELQKIHFLGGTAAEVLPLESASFDAVVSQYGIEYSDLERSVPEALRVLAPGGRPRFAVHAAEGSVAANTRSAIADADFLLDGIDLPGRAERCFEAVLRVERSGDSGESAMQEAEERFAAFRDALQLTAERLPNATDQGMLRNAHAVLYDSFEKRHLTDLPVLLAKAEELREEIAAHRERQAALLDAAKSKAEMERLAERLSELGMIDVRLGQQGAGGDCIAHTVEAVRAR